MHGAKLSQSCMTLCDPMDCSPPASSVHEILRQEYWSGLPRPSPEDLPNAGIKLASLMFLYWQATFFFFTTSATWEAPSSKSTKYKYSIICVQHMQ